MKETERETKKMEQLKQHKKRLGNELAFLARFKTRKLKAFFGLSLRFAEAGHR